MHIATSLNICFNRWPEQAFVSRLAKAGYDGMDFNFIDLTGRLDWQDEQIADRWLDQLHDAASAAKLVWVQGHGPMFNLFGDAADDARLRALCLPAIRACGRLKIPWMVLHPDTFSGPFDGPHRQAVLKQNMAFFQTLLPECEKTNVGLAIENLFDNLDPSNQRHLRRYYGSVPEELAELVDALNHPLVGVCWDTGHARIMRLDQRAALSALGARVKCVHIQENDGNNDDHMLPFYNGANGVDWQAVTDGLRAAGYKGAFTYEVHHAFSRVPDQLFDHVLHYSVTAAKYLVAQIETKRADG